MLKNTKENIEKVAVKLFGGVGIQNVYNYTKNRIVPIPGRGTATDNEFNHLVLSTIKNINGLDNVKAKDVGILNAITTMITYAVALYYGKYLYFPNELDAINDCIEVVKLIESKQELIETDVYNKIDIEPLVLLIDDYKSDLVDMRKYHFETKEIENDIIDSLFV